MKQKTSLTQDRLRALLQYDQETGYFTWITPRGRAAYGHTAGSIAKDGRWTIKIDERRYFRSRLAFLYMTGDWPDHEIDHRDRNRLNDCWENLREATRVQNSHNIAVHNDNKLGVKGVTRTKCHRFKAQIAAHGKLHYLGTFDTAGEASKAYDNAAVRLHGEFWRPSL